MVKSRKPIQWLNKSLSISRNGRTHSHCDLYFPTTTPSSRPSRDNELRELFRYFDKDGDGKISAVELRSFFASIGEYMSNEEARGVIDELDTDEDGQVHFDDFVSLMRMDGSKGVGSDVNLRMAFEMFEYEKGSGCITPKGLQALLGRLEDKESYEECKVMIKAFDVDGNGLLDCNQFNLMMA